MPAPITVLRPTRRTGARGTTLSAITSIALALLPLVVMIHAYQLTA